MYLGSSFTADGLVSSAVAADANLRKSHVMKFISFVQKNNDAPFYVKLKIFNACIVSSVTYGCESWLNGDLRPIQKLYNMCIKALLNVRNTTNNELCMVELGLPPLKALVKQRQRIFFKAMHLSRVNMEDDPFGHALRITMEARTPTARYLRTLLEGNANDVQEGLTAMHMALAENARNSTRNAWYNRMNTSYAVHHVYTSKSAPVPEHHRVAWTRLRLSAHSLAIEEGRWNRRGRGRLPVEERLCSCGQVQDEEHVIAHCLRTQHLRMEFGISIVAQFVAAHNRISCKFAFEILEEMK